MCNERAFVLTLAKSILSVQHPEYISAPFKLSRALVAASSVSNVNSNSGAQIRTGLVKENIFFF